MVPLSLLAILVSEIPSSAASDVNALYARQEAQTTSDLSYSSLYTSCTNYAATCPPILSTCVDNFCTSCASLGGSAFVSCCSQETAAACFSSLLVTSTATASTSAGAGNVSITGATPMATDSYSASCFDAFSMISSCASETPGFTSLDDGDQASCLCYSGSAYDPGPFDQLQSACVSYASTADPSDMSVYEAAAGLCTRVGNVRSATASISITEPPAPAPTTSIPVATRTLPSTTTSVGSATTPTATGAGHRQEIRTGWLLLQLLWLF